MECPFIGSFFECFVKGYHVRMKEHSKTDKAISIQIQLEITALLDEEWNDSSLSDPDRPFLVLEGACYLISFCAGLLRGEEVPLTDLMQRMNRFLSSLGVMNILV